MPTRSTKSLIPLVVLLALTPHALMGQKKRPAKLDQNLPLPSDFALDYQLGLTMRNQLRGSSSLLVDTPMNLAGDGVFRTLVGDTSVSGLTLPYRWNFTILNNEDINAYSLPDGEICVGSGLAKLVGTNSGLWAAVLSHETEHTARRHWVRKYMFEIYVQQQLTYYQVRAAAGDNSANWSILGLRIAAPIARAKLSRDLEHDADIQGMMLMAQEGYHPDYVFALHHLLRATTGDRSKFAAFFSTHPRWETRDQRDDKAYIDALAVYNARWPDPSGSPGGLPPLVAFAGKATSQENKQSKTADLTLPIYCRNATELTQAVILFEKDHKLVKTTSPEFAGPDGDLVYRQRFECSEKSEAVPVIVHLPATMVSKNNRKLEAHVEVFSESGTFLDQFRPITVHFPKP